MDFKDWRVYSCWGARKQGGCQGRSPHMQGRVCVGPSPGRGLVGWHLQGSAGTQLLLDKGLAQLFGGN